MKHPIIEQNQSLAGSGSVSRKITASLLKLESGAANWMNRYRIICLQISLGMIFLVFGALKFFPGFSPAENLAGDTLRMMSFGMLSPAISLPILAAWECLLGIGLMSGVTRGEQVGSLTKWRRVLLRVTLPALFFHMIGTAMPLFLMPECVFGAESGGPLLTLECQYILKNFVIVSAAIAVGGQRPHSCYSEQEAYKGD